MPQLIVLEWRLHFLLPLSGAFMLLQPAKAQPSPPCLPHLRSPPQGSESTVFCPAFLHDLGHSQYSSCCCGKIHGRSNLRKERFKDTGHRGGAGRVKSLKPLFTLCPYTQSGSRELNLLLNSLSPFCSSWGPSSWDAVFRVGSPTSTTSLETWSQTSPKFISWATKSPQS